MQKKEGYTLLLLSFSLYTLLAVFLMAPSGTEIVSSRRMKKVAQKSLYEQKSLNSIEPQMEL